MELTNEYKSPQQQIQLLIPQQQNMSTFLANKQNILEEIQFEENQVTNNSSLISLKN